MAEDVRRTQQASKAKIRANQKNQAPRHQSGEAAARNSPIGQRLAALRDRKNQR